MRYLARSIHVASLTLLIGIAGPTDSTAQTLSPQPVAASAPSRPVLADAAADDGRVRSSSIQDLVEDAIADFSRLPSWPNLAILTAGGIGALAGHANDGDV